MATSTVAKGRLLDLAKAQCKLFETTFNPTGKRLGNKILRERLKGPALAAYYPRKSLTVEDMMRDFNKKHELESWNDDEEDRLEAISIAQLRGKGAPKKIRETGGKKSKKKGGKK